jgi:RNA polymerase sigma-70 factor, ECF subfamily
LTARTTITNTELVQRMRTEPASAAPLLYGRYEPLVRSLVHRMLGPDADHGDLVQQIFRELMESSFDLREPEKLPGWVRSVAMCVVYEELRTRHARRRFEASFVQHATANFEHDVEVRDLLSRAGAMIATLPHAERTVFIMRTVEGRSCLEVAALSGCSTATIKRRLARAHRRLQGMISRNVELVRLARSGGSCSFAPGGRAAQRLNRARTSSSESARP